MDRRAIIRAIVAAGAAVLLLAPAALADTCCANTKVGLSPASAPPGTTVTLTGLRCLAADNTGPLALKLESFWLRPGAPFSGDPNVVPGPGLPTDLPPTGRWHRFDGVSQGADGTGSATIIVPSVTAGTYQLWWFCDVGSAGPGIHYSTGPLLAVGAAPDTATAVDRPASSDPRAPLVLLLASGVGILVAALTGPRQGRPTRRRPNG